MPSFPLAGERCVLRPWRAETSSRSCRTLEKAGHVREGRMRQRFLKDGETHDQLCYAWVVP